MSVQVYCKIYAMITVSLLPDRVRQKDSTRGIWHFVFCLQPCFCFAAVSHVSVQVHQSSQTRSREMTLSSIVWEKLCVKQKNARVGWAVLYPRQIRYFTSLRTLAKRLRLPSCPFQAKCCSHVQT